MFLFSGSYVGKMIRRRKNSYMLDVNLWTSLTETSSRKQILPKTNSLTQNFTASNRATLFPGKCLFKANGLTNVHRHCCLLDFFKSREHLKVIFSTDTFFDRNVRKNWPDFYSEDTTDWIVFMVGWLLRNDYRPSSKWHLHLWRTPLIFTAFL